MVIWPAFRMEKYRVNDHPYHAPQFITLKLPSPPNEGARQTSFSQAISPITNLLLIIVYLNFIRPGMFYVIFGTGRGENTKVNPVTHFFMATHLSWHYLILIIVHITKKR